jgi:hypothetical protein
MKKIFRVEKVNIIDNNLDFTAVKIRILVFKKVVFSYSYKPKNRFKNPLKYI